MELVTPISEEDVRRLKVGDVIYVTGTLFLARDEAHRKMLEEGAPIPTEGGVLYHCGPVVMKVGDEWKVVSAGPTTSARMEMFEYDFIKRFGVRIIIGKGGMGERTQKALAEFGAVYAAYTGGAGALAARSIKRVREVYWLDELGIPEAVWVFEVERFGPLVVAMDSHGGNVYRVVNERVRKVLEEGL